jgi:uncharacterized protein
LRTEREKTAEPIKPGTTDLAQTDLTQTDLTQTGLTQTGLTQTGLTQDERTLALLAHMLQIMLWWIAPLAIFLIKRQSKFVSFHALQAVLLQVVYLLSIITGFILWFGVIFLTMAAGAASRHAHPPPEFFILMPLLWLCFMGMGVLVLLAAIVYGVKAGRGEWAEYPILGQLALKILKLGPGGTPA